KLAPYLVDAGWEVTVYGRDGSTKEDDPERDPRVRSVVTRGFELKSISTLSYGLTASVHAFRQKPDVALVMNVANGYFLPLLKLRGIRTLVNVDGIEWHRAKWGPRARKVFRIGARFTKWFGDALVYDSVEIARRWRDTFERDGHYIPYGGDVPPDLPIEPGFTHRGYVLVCCTIRVRRTPSLSSLTLPRRYRAIFLWLSSALPATVECSMRRLPIWLVKTSPLRGWVT
ncbi:DUF1972 domain-containing protein, partial [Agrobacterium sp. S2]|nr:DUF1972 domain-containing protein [Agrobacterium sp. S2]